MRVITLFISLILALSLVASAQSNDPGPVYVDYKDTHETFGFDCTGIHINGNQAQCIATNLYAGGATASFGIGALDNPLPVLVAGLDGKFHVNVNIQTGDGVSALYTGFNGDVTLTGSGIGGTSISEDAVASDGSAGFTFEISGEENTGASVDIVMLSVAGVPYNAAAEVAFLAGEYGASDLIQTHAPGTPVLLIKTPPLSSLDGDGDGVLDAVDNCPETDNGPLEGDDIQADNDLDGIGDACDEDDEDGNLGDKDGDGFPNAVEDATGSDPNDGDITPLTVHDRDGDMFPNAVEELFQSDPDDAESTPLTVLDRDGDGFPNAVEATLGSDPDDPASTPITRVVADSDGDKFPDVLEEQAGSDPEDPESTPPSELLASIDGDGDGFPDDVETALNSDPEDKESTPLTVMDRDGDGFINALEATVGSDPDDEASTPITYLSKDSDGDNFPDVVEEAAGSDPEDPESTPLTVVGQLVDTDGDGFADAIEEAVGSDPEDPESTPLTLVTADTDGDGYPDLVESAAGSDPEDPESQPDPSTQVDADGDGHIGIEAVGGLSVEGTTILDNCPNQANPEQEDLDGDDIGDVCDDDIDGDGDSNADETAAGSDPRDENSTVDDLDGDGHNNDVETAAGSDPTDATSVPDDHDGDGVRNSDDKCPGHDDNVDADNDGTPDGCDADHADGPDGDSDGDGINNTVDDFPNDANETEDLDKDGVGDNGDNCSPTGSTGANGKDTGYNPTQADFDGDGLGDACDDDIDGDDVPNDEDRCPGHDDSIDADGDGIVDGCDPGADDGPEADSDGDGVPNKDDAFPNDASISEDADGDGVPDDGPEAGRDNCPNFVNPGQKDVDGDGIGDPCDPDDNDGPKGDLDGDGYSNGAEDTAGSDKNSAASIPSDRDGDGWSNQAEIDADTDPDDADDFPEGTPPSEAEQQAQLKALSAELGATLKGKTAYGDMINVTLTFDAPDAATGIQVLRSNSPYQVIAELPATATTYTDVNTTIGARYMLVAYAAGDVGKVLENATNEAPYLSELEADGMYYEVVAQVDDGTIRNGNTEDENRTLVVEVYDENGNLVRTETKSVKVPAHGTATYDIEDINTEGGASYEVFLEGDDGERTAVASGVVSQGPDVSEDIFWLVVGSVLLLGIFILMIAGIVAYARQPEEAT